MSKRSIYEPCPECLVTAPRWWLSIPAFALGMVVMALDIGWLQFIAGATLAFIGVSDMVVIGTRRAADTLLNDQQMED